MKRILFFTVLVFFAMQIYAQQEQDSVYLTPNDLIGTWQQNSSIVGNGLRQNFVFYKDGDFVINFWNALEDARILVGLKGKYRLVKDEIYFTIKSRIILANGEIAICDPGIDFCVFSFNGGTLKEIPEDNPQELEPCYITVFDKKHIKINNEEYYKVSDTELKDE